MDVGDTIDRELSTLSYVMGTIQFCRDELEEIDANISADLDRIIREINGRLEPVDTLSHA